MAWSLRLHRLARSATSALPLESAAIAVAVVSVWWQVAAFRTELAERAFFAAVLAVPLLFTVTLVRRGGRLSVGAARCLAALGVAAALAVTFTGAAIDEAFAWRFGLSLLAAVMLPFVAVAAAAPPGERLLAFADFVRRFCEETTASGLLGGLAIGAAAVLVGSIQALFHVRLERFGVDVAALIAGLTALAYLHRLVADEGAGRVPDLWRRLIARVAAPFLAAMLAMLVVYELWVLAQGELPANLISPLILAAGAIGFASTLVIESLVAVRQERVLAPANPHPWTQTRPVRLSRAFTAVLLALLPLAAWSLWVRIDQHGLTQLRVARLYGLGALGLLAAWGTVRWARRRRPLGWEVPAVTAAIAVVAAVGQLSVNSLSLRSQEARLAEALGRAGIAREVHAVPPAETIEMDGPRFDELAERIDALVEVGGTAALGDLLGGHLEACARPWPGARCLEHLGVARAGAPPASPMSEYLHAEIDPKPGGMRVVEVGLSRPVETGDLGRISLRIDRDVIVLERGGMSWGRAAIPEAIWRSEDNVPPLPPFVDLRGCEVAYPAGRSAIVSITSGEQRLAELDVVVLIPPEPRCADGSSPPR